MILYSCDWMQIGWIAELSFRQCKISNQQYFIALKSGITRYTWCIIPVHVHASARRELIITCYTTLFSEILIFRYFSAYKFASIYMFLEKCVNKCKINALYCISFCYLHNHTMLSMLIHLIQQDTVHLFTYHLFTHKWASCLWYSLLDNNV